MYEEKDFSNLLGMEGFSDELLKDHFKLYNGYVKNTNELMKTLKVMTNNCMEFSELKRRFGWEFNGMRLHELYFGNLVKGGKKLNEDSKIAKKLIESFGNLGEWECDFRGSASMRGIGWVILAYDPESDKVFNLWVNEHDAGHLVGAIPLLVMDVFEHAFIRDYGLGKRAYLESFIKNINWDEVEKRLK